MITGISTNYLSYDSYGQPASVDVQLTFVNMTTEEKELIRKLQMRILQGITVEDTEDECQLLDV
jgi:hypothetical protein